MNKVVPFARSATYLRERAEKNRQSKQLLDALDLSRFALEKEPENTEILLEIARTYREMGCYDQSIRTLLSALTLKPILPEAYLGMSLNFYSSGDKMSANVALMMHMAGNPQALKNPDVVKLMEKFFIEDLFDGSGRKKKRADRLFAEGALAARNGASRYGIRLLERCVSVNSKHFDARTALACALMDVQEPEKALTYLAPAIRGKKPHIPSMCAAVCAKIRLDDPKGAKALIRRIQARPLRAPERRVLAEAAVFAGEYALALPIILRELRDTPYNSRLLKLGVLSATHLDGSRGVAEDCLTRLYRINPNDPVAEYYLKRLDETPPLSDYRLPESVRDERENRLVLLSALAPYDLAAAWRDPDVRKLCAWALEDGSERMASQALDIAIALFDKPAELMLRHYIMRGSASSVLKFKACQCLCERAADSILHYRLNGRMSLLFPKAHAPEDIKSIPLSYRKAIRIAVRHGQIFTRAHASDEKDPARTASQTPHNIAELAKNFVDSFDSPRPIQRISENLAAALFLTAFEQIPDVPSPRQFARQTGCSRRAVQYYLKRIHRVRLQLKSGSRKGRGKPQ